MIENIIAQQAEAGERLDSFLAKKYPDYSRNYFGNLIKKSKVAVNDKSVKPSYLLQKNDLIRVEIAESNEDKKGIVPQEIPLNIIYEDNNVIVINKQPGLVVHPGSGVYEGTLVNALLNHFPKIKEAVYIKGNALSEQRPGLVHRLDKDTSGVIIIAKNSRSMHSLSRQIQNRTIKKIYLALCYGWPTTPSGRLVNYLGRHPVDRKMFADIGQEKGREAISDYKVINYLSTKDEKKAALIEFDIKTGRTHQIRVQSKIIGHPILGDSIYNRKESTSLSQKLKIKRQMLHAKRLEITLPGNNKPSIFEADLPSDFEKTLSHFSKID